ncbi:unnamed protein product [Rotaria magnacalcarata]|uniref:F-box domain-containing protein n=1 Tax=Rotaria magnacalcarata TaxID=392030 RepID=A0A819GFM3_9BILA|nr:unnamed protein product [Rotaria magnacalcarata]CAF2123864.1 unnamed protein product [Rotaria magnacalcarata]CAF3878908.1 unnamed protein product [Rotaria magnacalcarata]CAF4221180.1 unnamed protein product [Rotaria magnacalcarata]
MEYSRIQLDDLPDEILLIIFEKLNKLSVLYSLAGVNKRLNVIAHSPNFTSRLNLLRCLSDHSIRSLPKRRLERFCSQILPEIHHKIKWLNLEPISIKRILLSTTYPALYGLGLYCNNIEDAMSLFTSDTTFNHTVKNQISSLVINIRENINSNSSQCFYTNLFSLIFTTFLNLQYFNFAQSSLHHQRLSFGLSSPTLISSSLLELNVRVQDFTDCLHLLDGRFSQLRTFRVDVYRIFSASSRTNNKVKLPDLKSFSLHCDMRTHAYDELIMPLLRRMLNLETLDLHLNLDFNTGFIDGNHLKENIVNPMLRLNKFTFNICLFNYLPHEIDLPSNDEFQNTFNNILDHQIISCLDYFHESHYSYFHFYTFPYTLKSYDNITNNFPGGLFDYVHTISLHDERPFESDFFLRIALSFPSMTSLTVINQQPQKNDNQYLSIIKYPHLKVLNLIEANDDYVEQFLVDNKCDLPNYVCLYAKIESLTTVTHNFTRDVTRINCSKVNYISFDDVSSFSKDFRKYFLHVDIDM